MGVKGRQRLRGREVMCVTAPQRAGWSRVWRAVCGLSPWRGGGEQTGRQVQGGYLMGLSPRHVTKVSALTSLMYLDLKSLGEAQVSLNDVQRTGFLYVSLRMGLVKGFCD